MKRGEAIFFIGVFLSFVGLLSYPIDADLLGGLLRILGGFGSVFMLTGLAMWWVDRKKSLKRYIDQRVKAESERRLRTDITDIPIKEENAPKVRRDLNEEES